MDTRRLIKADGRKLILYARDRVDVRDEPSPSTAPFAPNAHLRWHPLRAEWVAYATHRQHRTFLPPADYNPLAPTTNPDHPTEVPSGRWDVAVFENLFPTLTRLAHDPPQLFVPTGPALGACEVVVFTQDPSASLGALPLWHIELVLDVWADRYERLGAREDVSTCSPSRTVASRLESRCIIRTARSTRIPSCHRCRRARSCSNGSITSSTAEVS
jgi:UDPglucose--hexose-1-phosphate uridylyltransferase